MFDSVLVANRGEIAVRIIRTLRALGIRSIAVYSDADRHARHVLDADVAVRLGPAPAAASYLDADRILAAAAATGAAALHPGYGFISENAAFARRCQAAGVVFIGPPPEAIEAMGDKITAKRLVSAAGVAVVPGTERSGLSDTELIEAALAIGLPVLLKPSAGGGGKGMHRVDQAEHLAEAVATARREAAAAFADDRLLVERFVSEPRHIEVQVFADSFGRVLHLGERECSLQRRHQKVVEEAPSPFLDEDSRRAMGAAAVAAAAAVGYVGAGTVEFIVSGEDPGNFFFMEMNTRLQVEHAVTEAITGLDLVELQLRVAAGEPLGFEQGDVVWRGHAIEARVYAENPARQFLPSVGRVLRLREPTRPGLRLDSGLREGTEVGTAYDPMLAKVIAWGEDRSASLARLDAGLAHLGVLGVSTNIGFLRTLLAHPEVVAGHLDTELVERVAGDLVPSVPPPELWLAAALFFALGLEPSGTVTDPWDVPSGWRLGSAAPTVFALRCGGVNLEVTVDGRAAAATARVGEQAAVSVSAALDNGDLVVAVDGVLTCWLWALDGHDLWLGRQGAAWVVVWSRQSPQGTAPSAATGGPVTSPMPGTILALAVGAGDAVGAGQLLVTVEAMKMELRVTAPVAGVVRTVLVAVGQSVALDETLMEIDASGLPAEGSDDHHDRGGAQP